MYCINRKVDKPDFDFLLKTIKGLVEDKGIKVDDLAVMRERMESKIETYRDEVERLTGIKNPRSSQQVKEYFGGVFDRDVIDCCIDKQTGEVLTDKSVMETLAEKGRQDAILITKYRKEASKLNVIKSLEKESRDGRIHPKVSLLVSNRVSYTAPALMNIHKELLWDVVLPDNGKNIWSVDIRNQEPQIVAYYLRVKEVKEALESGKGVYEELFRKVYPNEELTETKRSEFKTAWNALTYGCGASTVKHQLKQLDPKPLMKFFKGLTGMKDHKARCKDIVGVGRNYIDTYFGTRLESPKVGNELVRSLMDLAIQGTGADILALLVKHFMETKEEGFELYYTRHDELILQVDRDIPCEHVEEVLTNMFTHKVDDWMPFQVKITKVTDDIH